MAARLDSVAEYIWRKSDQSLSNLALQKILYLAHMFNLGRTKGMPLFKGHFEAWDYGPVEPTLYHKLKRFGGGQVDNVFHEARVFNIDDPRRKVMDDVCRKFLDFDPGDLVEITHWDEGAWAAHYIPGVRHIRIPDADIRAEYDRRQRRTA